LNIDEIRKEFYNRGFILITDKYINSRQKFSYICPKGHTGSMRIDHLRRGIGCSKCSGNRKLTIDFIRKEFLSNGYRLITTNYINSSQKLKYICPNNHFGSISWNNWYLGHRCMKCFGKEKHSYNYIHKSISAAGEKLLSKVYNNSKELLEIMCKNGHTYFVSWDNWNSKGVRCSECRKIGTSAAENELYEFLLNYSNNILRNNRELIKPYEIDLLLQDYSLAIEYCGLYWHSEYFGKDSNYHINKHSSCLNKGYKLITIFEDEWVSNKDIVKKLLHSFLNSCVEINDGFNVTSIHIETYKHFLCKNSLSNFVKDSDFIFGVFLKHRVVGVIGLSNYYDGLIIDNFIVKSEYYNIRFSILNEILIYIDKCFDKKYIIISLDLRWESYTLELYNLGFNKNIFIKPKGWYFNNNKGRFSSSKDKNRNKIYDCGYIESLRFIEGKGLSYTLPPRFVSDNKDEVLLANLSNF
jgi:hypothetical protein